MAPSGATTRGWRTGASSAPRSWSWSPPTCRPSWPKSAASRTRRKPRCCAGPTTGRRSPTRSSKVSAVTRARTRRRERKEAHRMAETLNVGIDLGTSRSAISASNGERFVVDSFVGWPVDMVARKVLKRDVLIGHEAVANRTMLDLHRPLERGLLKEGSEKDVEAVRELLKHLLRLVGVSSNGKIDGSNVRAVVGVPAASLRTNKQYLRNSMKGIVDSLMIVSEPFAVAY